MPDPGRLRDSTEIVLPCAALDGVREDLHERFTVTVVAEDEHCRIIGSPVVIKRVGDFLARHGVSIQ
jgi:hypothetical protein